MIRLTEMIHSGHSRASTVWWSTLRFLALHGRSLLHNRSIRSIKDIFLWSSYNKSAQKNFCFFVSITWQVVCEFQMQQRTFASRFLQNQHCIYIYIWLAIYFKYTTNHWLKHTLQCLYTFRLKIDKHKRFCDSLSICIVKKINVVEWK